MLRVENWTSVLTFFEIFVCFCWLRFHNKYKRKRSKKSCATMKRKSSSERIRTFRPLRNSCFVTLFSFLRLCYHEMCRLPCIDCVCPKNNKRRTSTESVGFLVSGVLTVLFLPPFVSPKIKKRNTCPESWAAGVWVLPRDVSTFG